MGVRKCHAFLVLGLLLCLVPARRSEAVNPETLLMPGKLTNAHAKYEEQCSSCHDRSDRNRQTRLCLDCHKEIASDIGAKHGFHGHLAGIATSQCRGCHSEHLGRSADIVKLSPDQFDHDGTDFPLRDAHAGVVCTSCHLAGKPYRKAPVECVECHKKDEPHQGKLGRDCGACHDAVAWHRTRFDHDKTAYPLRDKHTDVPCMGCHFGNHYKGTPKECVSCHAPDDVHRGERGEKCGGCHSTTGWKTAKFDHFKETGFALEGAHASIDCQDCHRSGNLQEKIPKDCFGCHEGQDSHAGRLGSRCEQCHGNDKWKPSTFDHSRDGHWELTGRHQKVECHTCHTAVVAVQKLPTECSSCHRASDVHAGKLGMQCEQCHTTEGWKASVAFDHDLTNFPLVGLHVAVPCEQCHTTRKYRDVGHDCNDCHERDDVHHGSLGSDCAKCHSPNGWRLWEFDHGKATGFALSGTHGKLACEGCHKQPPDQVKLNPSCLSCHLQDDVHLGQYGRQCQRCHTTITFNGARLQ
jgi:hypothetical protein